MNGDNDVPIEAKRAIVRQEISMHRNTIYLLQVRHKVNKRLSNPPEVLKQIEDEIVKEERAVDILGEELAGLDAPHTDSDTDARNR